MDSILNRNHIPKPGIGLGDVMHSGEGFPDNYRSSPDTQSLTEQFLQNSDASEAISADRAWAEAQAQKQMDFQERMSSTAYQRAIDDMKKAGLNPALAYGQGGAQSAAGAMAQSGSTQQIADKTREDNMFALLNSLVISLGRIVSSAGSGILKGLIPK